MDAGRVRLGIRDHAGGEPALVCLHGLASNARWWDLVAARLAPRHRVVAVDLPGHGRSDRPEAGYGFEDVGSDVHALVDALGVGRHLLAGHSWGASVALWCAAARPAGVLGVACVDGGAVDLRSVFGGSWETAERAMTPPRLQGLTEADLRRWVGASGLAEGSDPDRATAILLGNFEAGPDGTGLRPRLSLDRHMAIARTLFEQDVPALWRGLGAVPALLALASGSDPGPMAARREAAEVAESLHTGATLVRWIEGGHDLPVQRPDAVAAAIAELIALTGAPEPPPVAG